MNIRPIYKSIHPIIDVGKGILRLGETADIAVEIEDKEGSIHKLIRLMDGTKNIIQIHQDLVKEYPFVTYEETLQAIQDLHELGFLYDKALDNDSKLTEKEMERFKANINYFNHYSNFKCSPYNIQEKLTDSKVTILGVGSVGGHILLHLAGLGIKNIKVVDFDQVSLNNLNRQILFKEIDINRPKIDVAKEYMSLFYSSMNIETFSLKVNSITDIEQIIKDSDLVILAADTPSFKIQRWTNKACNKLNIPFIGGGINLNQGNFYTFIPSKTPCFDCMLLHHSNDIDPNFPSHLERLLNLEEPQTNLTLPNLSLLVGIISNEILRLLTGISDVMSAGKVIVVDFEKYKISSIDECEYAIECPTCGSGDENHKLFKVIALNS